MGERGVERSRVRARVLIVDDNIEMARAICEELDEAGMGAMAVESGAQALSLLRGGEIDALVTDLRMPEVDGMVLLRESQRLSPERPVIVMTAYGAIDSAVAAIREGAYHYLTKPFKGEELLLFLRRALEGASLRREAQALRRTLRERFGQASLVGNSAALREVLEVVERVADSDTPLLIGGETGTGKGLLARVVHAASPRASGPFLPINCAALPEALLESELFGHERGAFTGAHGARKGLFAEASGGTLLLDEVGELPLGVQAKLLQVLEEGTVRPIGANRALPVDARIIAATHRDLRALVRDGRFREDLYYRLDVVSVTMPALRHRVEDVPLLLSHFLEEHRRRHRRSPVRGFSAPAVARLQAHSWPGNVREMSHVVERLVLLGKELEIQEAELPVEIREPTRATMPVFSGEVLPIRQIQRLYVAWALDQVGGHRGRAAEKLGIDVKTLYNWLSTER